MPSLDIGVLVLKARRACTALQTLKTDFSKQCTEREKRIEAFIDSIAVETLDNNMPLVGVRETSINPELLEMIEDPLDGLR